MQLSNSAILARMLSCNTRSWVHHAGLVWSHYPPAIKRGNGKSPRNGGLDGKIVLLLLTPCMDGQERLHTPDIPKFCPCSELHQWYTQSQLLASKNLMAPAPGITWIIRKWSVENLADSLLDEVDGDGSQLQDANAQVWHISNVGASQLCPGSLYSYQKLHMCT